MTDTNGYTVIAADVDGDSDQDVAVATYSDDTIEVFENILSMGDPINPFARHSVSGNGEVGIASVYAADVNGDGVLDLLPAAASAPPRGATLRAQVLGLR